MNSQRQGQEQRGRQGDRFRHRHGQRGQRYEAYPPPRRQQQQPVIDNRFLLNTYLNMYDSARNDLNITNNRIDILLQNINELSNHFMIQNLRQHQTQNQNQNSDTSSTLPFSQSSISTMSTFDDNIRNLMANFLNPIPIIPTNRQINDATRRLTFGNIANPVNTECIFTREEFARDSDVIQITHCSHNFTPDALSTWFIAHSTCPICRYDIRGTGPEPNPSTNNDSSSNGINTIYFDFYTRH
jgi:hypothetical protein